MTGVLTITAYGLREALRRRVFTVVLLLTAAFLVLFWLAARYVFDHVDEIQPPAGVDGRTFAGAFMLGLAMFATQFLGVVLAVFVTLGVVQGDAERGLLQPLVVRPVGRAALLLARFLGAAVVCVPYVLVVYFGALVIVGVTGDWWPDRILLPGLELAGGVLVVAALSLLGSIFLGPTANGIAIFMIFGAGLVAGLLGNIGDALNAEKLIRVARGVAWAIPFEALYQDGLRAITEDTSGITGFVLQLGPFGGASSGGWELRVYAAVYLVLVLVVAVVAFARRDL